MAEHFGWFDVWKTTPLRCNRCGWVGTFEQGRVELRDELMDSSCPQCNISDAPMLAIASFPTIKESEEHWSELAPDDQASVLSRKAFLADWEASSQRAQEQLPEIARSEDLILEWDIEEYGETEYTVIRLRGIELWRELALWEGYERFRDVVSVLKQKYGRRLLDVVPTAEGLKYLGGDFLGAHEHIAETRRLIREPESVQDHFPRIAVSSLPAAPTLPRYTEMSHA
jgi:hypothetical protein